ncbi:MAG TPA: hypothetical protein VHE37_04435, partial [Nevskiaceae bacterium]|nr:hypothetical protein [Nevskiaceae bacterium]
MIRASFIEYEGAAPQPVTLHIMSGMVWIKTGDVIERRVALSDLKIAPLRGTSQKLTLPDGSWCDIPDQPAITELIEEVKGDTVRLAPAEREPVLQRLAGALFTFVLLLVAAAVAVWSWGVPHAAQTLAAQMPAAQRAALGQRVLASLDADGTLTP